MLLKVKNNVDCSTSPKSNFLTRILLIGSFISGQTVLVPLSAQAQSVNTTIDGNCGVYRPFIKGTTSGSGYPYDTWGNVDASLRRWNGFAYEEIAYQSSEKTGSSATASAESGVPFATGWFEGDTYHDFAYWSSGFYRYKGEFRC